jgi:dipeptidyl aminopeptidase/acylaminoacyl peptidase
MNEPERTFKTLNEIISGSSLPGTPLPRVPVTPETLTSLRTPMDASASPNGRYVAFVVWEYVGDEQKQRGRIWIARTDECQPRPLTKGPIADTCPRWSPDSQQLAFISREKGEDGKGKSQIYVITAPSDEGKLLCTIPNGVSNLAWAPDGRCIAFTSLEGKEPQTDPLVITPARHKRLWTIRLDSVIPEPVTPDGCTIWEYAWSPNSRQLAVYFTIGPDETDWYRGQIGIALVDGGAIRQVTHLTRQASSLTWSPDGTQLAYISGEWSDRGLVGGDVFVLTLATGAVRNITPDIGFSPSWIGWFPDGQQFLYAGWSGVTDQIGFMDANTGATIVLFDDFVIGDPPQPRLSPTPDMYRFAVTHSTPQCPPEVWYVDLVDVESEPRDIRWRPLSRLNSIAEETLAISPNQRISYESVDGWRIDGLFTPPLTRKSDGPPPLVVLVHGGPSAAWTDSFSALTQLLAAAGYAVLRENFRGSLGRGVAFADAVIGDMGGKEFQDIMSGVDYLVKRGMVDGNRLAIMGGSYGGFMTAWAVTQTTRFKAAVVSAGVTDFHSFHAQSNIPDWDMRFIGASPLERPDLYRQRSAITFAGRVKTPTLIIHGEKDESVPVNQAYAFYRALRERAVPTELVVYPREGHSIRERDHLRDYVERVLRWFEKYV